MLVGESGLGSGMSWYISVASNDAGGAIEVARCATAGAGGAIAGAGGAVASEVAQHRSLYISRSGDSFTGDDDAQHRSLCISPSAGVSSSAAQHCSTQLLCTRMPHDGQKVEVAEGPTFMLSPQPRQRARTTSLSLSSVHSGLEPVDASPPR